MLYLFFKGVKFRHPVPFAHTVNNSSMKLQDSISNHSQWMNVTNGIKRSLPKARKIGIPFTWYWCINKRYHITTNIVIIKQVNWNDILFLQKTALVWFSSLFSMLFSKLGNESTSIWCIKENFTARGSASCYSTLPLSLSLSFFASLPSLRSSFNALMLQNAGGIDSVHWAMCHLLIRYWWEYRQEAN